MPVWIGLVKHFDKIALSCTVKEIEANFFFQFLEKFRKFKLAAIFGKRKFFFKLPRVHCLDSPWVENFDEIVLSHTVKEIEGNLFLSHF